MHGAYLLLPLVEIGEGGDCARFVFVDNGCYFLIPLSKTGKLSILALVLVDKDGGFDILNVLLGFPSP